MGDTRYLSLLVIHCSMGSKCYYTGKRENMIKLCANLKIRNKIFFSFIFLIIMALLAVSVYFISYTTKIYNETMKTSGKNTLQLISEKYDLTLKSVEKQVENIITDATIQEIMADQSIVNEYQDFQHRQSVNNILSDFKKTWPIINEFLLIKNNQKVYSSNHIYYELSDELKEELAKFEKQKQPIMYIAKVDKKIDLLLVRKLFNENTGAYLGMVCTKFNERELYKLFAEFTKDTTVDIYLVDKEGGIISNGDTKKVGKKIEKYYDYEMIEKIKKTTHGKYRIQNQNYLFIYQENSVSHAGLIEVIRLNTLSKFIKDALLSITGVIIFITCIVSILAYFLSSSITKPLNELKDTMMSIRRGDVEARAKIKSKDEIAVLAMEFNSMTDKIGFLLEELRKEERDKKQYEIKIIQSQINPHFLYNTIDNICGLVITNQNKNALKMLKSLSTFYRGVLNEGNSNSMLTIAKEIQIMESYLQIMKFRYQEKLEYAIEVNFDMKMYTIPKMLLQPIVENAIIHGIRAKEGSGYIQVMLKKEKESISICIQDNGKGMSQEKLDEIVYGKTEEKDISFGIKSIQQRLDIIYDKKSKFVISSKEDTGTKVDIEIPVSKKEVGYEQSNVG